MTTDTLAIRGNPSVNLQARRNALVWAAFFLGFIGLSSLIGLRMLTSGPNLSTLAWLFFLAGAACILIQPRYGIYLIAGLSLVGDFRLLAWYPFTKNLSSRESLLFFNDAVIISPLEIYIGVTALSWIIISVSQRKFKPFLGPLFWPLIVFIAFVSYGLFRGLSRSGDTVVALWEARAMFYLPVLVVLGSNLLETRAHINKLLWVVAISLLLRGLAGSWYVADTLQFDFGRVESIGEHSMSILFNSIFVITIVAWLLRDRLSRRIWMLPIVLPVFISYIANNRRASYITMTLAFVLIGISLYRLNRKLFYYIVPLVSVIGIAYLGAFWRASGPIAGPAKAVRSVIGQPDPRDYSSNLYRTMENINIMFTIKTDPIRGIGFGQKFYRISAMVHLEFPFSDYLTHNSILWMWMKTGVGGFMAMLFFMGYSVMIGGRLIWRTHTGPLAVAAVVATLALFMQYVFTYVDMAWSTVPMVHTGLMLALVNCIERVAQRPEPLPAKRWPWQADAQPPRPLLPLPVGAISTWKLW